MALCVKTSGDAWLLAHAGRPPGTKASRDRAGEGQACMKPAGLVDAVSVLRRSPYKVPRAPSYTDHERSRLRAKGSGPGSIGGRWCPNDDVVDTNCIDADAPNDVVSPRPCFKPAVMEGSSPVLLLFSRLCTSASAVTVDLLRVSLTSLTLAPTIEGGTPNLLGLFGASAA